MAEQTTAPNAADRSQVGVARRQQERLALQQANDLREVLSSQAGRRFVFRLLEHCSVFSSINTGSSQIYANAGRQDVGHFIMAIVEQVDGEALFAMMREAKQARDANTREAEAIRTPSVGAGVTTGRDSNGE